MSESEANALTTWSPSHGAMLVDEANAQSVNFFPLPSGRYALARTREGCGEYSGRGGRQLFTRVVIVDVTHLKRADYQVFAVYRDALAQGHLAYDRNASPTLPRVELSGLFPPWQPPRQLPGMTLSEADSVVAGLAAGRTEVVAYDGDRTARRFEECCSIAWRGETHHSRVRSLQASHLPRCVPIGFTPWLRNRWRAAAPTVSPLA